MQRLRFIGFFVLIACLGIFSSCGIGKNSKVVLNPSKIGITTLRYFDRERSRPLITEVWYPVQENAEAQPVAGLWIRCPEARDAPIKLVKQKYPLIVMSHGNAGDRLNGAWMAEILATNGFIVAAMDHHGNTWNNKIAEFFIKIWERPKDVSFIIDQILQDPLFGPHIDSGKIGFVGYSLGGQTGVWLAGGKLEQLDKNVLKEMPADQIPNTVTSEMIEMIDFSPATESYKDSRVSAFFLMAPALGFLFDAKSLECIREPIYIVAPEGDQIVPLETSPKLLAKTVQRAIYNLIPGAANHYIFLNEVTKGGKMILDKALAFDPPNVDRKKVHEELGVAAVLFFKDHLNYPSYIKEKK